MKTETGLPLLLDVFVTIASDFLIPIMILGFLVGGVLRLLTYYTVKREEWFSREFEKRVTNFLDKNDELPSKSFYVLTKKILEKTFYDLFELRFHMRRRKPDFIMTWADRVFLIKQGCAWFVFDILKRIKTLRHSESSQPKLFEISKKTLAHNPCFKKVFGGIPASETNDILNIMPGVFIVLGVFGTFLGIMRALPELGGMDLTDVEGTKNVMDMFLVKISFSMTTSLIGIVLSILMSFLNAAFSPEKVFVAAVDRMESSLDSLWQVSRDNSVPNNLPEFDENRLPEEILAEQAVSKELLPKDKRKAA